MVDPDSQSIIFKQHRSCGNAVGIRFRVSLKFLSVWRAAASISVIVNMIQPIDPHFILYGPNLDKYCCKPGVSKGSARHVAAHGISLVRWEPAPWEDVEVWFTVPNENGNYLVWITTLAYGTADGTGVSRYVIKVRNDTFRIRRVSYLGTWCLRLGRWLAEPNPHELAPFPNLNRRNYWS